MDIDQLKKFIDQCHWPAFRLKQIVQSTIQGGAESFDQVTALSLTDRQSLADAIPFYSFQVENLLESKEDFSAKALLLLPDGKRIETVLISPKPGLFSVCLSSQVGCPLGCVFCATGRMGLHRNLTVGEITDQVLMWQHYLKKHPHRLGASARITNIVFMGMGEPLLNWDNVSRSIEILTDPNYFGFGSRSLSVSTAGIPDGIANLASQFPQVNLALSLHFADDAIRDKHMPVNRMYDLEKLRQALQNYFQQTKRKVFLEYILLDQVNDFEKDASLLAQFIRSVGRPALLHVNLIRYNETADQAKPSSKARAAAFKKALLSQGISATIRKSLGQDIQGACGQLAGKGN